jgi:aminomethyltransferase
MILCNLTIINNRNVVVNAGCKENDLQNLYNAKEEHWKNKDVHIEYIEDRSLIALQGPKAAGVLQHLVAGNLSNLNFMEASFMAIPNIEETVLVSRCGYTGEDGFEISVSNKNAVKLFDLFLKNNEVRVCGLGARDTLRLEAGLCLYGHDINEYTNPIEASLKWVIGKRRKTTGGFPGYEIIKNQMETETNTKRVGFIIESGPPAREEAKIYSSEDKQNIIGRVTSGSYSPCLKKPIGMAYINTKFTKLNTVLKVTVRNKDYDLKISKMPFVPNRYYKKKTNA